MVAAALSLPSSSLGLGSKGKLPSDTQTSAALSAEDIENRQAREMVLKINPRASPSPAAWLSRV